MHVDEDPLCESLSLVLHSPSDMIDTDDHAIDERLGKAFKASPPTEDMYVFQNNAPALGPSVSSA